MGAFSVQDSAGKAVAAERAVEIQRVHGAEGADAMVEEARVATDKALDRRDAVYGDLNLSMLDERVQEALDATIKDRDELASLRKQIDTGAMQEKGFTASYNNLIDSALNVPRVLSDTVQERDLAQYLDAYVASNVLMSQVTLELPVVAFLFQDIASGEFTSSDGLTVARLIGEGDAKHTEARKAVRELHVGSRSRRRSATTWAAKQHLRQQRRRQHRQAAVGCRLHRGPRGHQPRP
ncbi:nitrate- and nitrite sensing domain-containing protein [Oerskovia sp. M15]